MELFPAIDLFGGRAVRLLHGDYSQMTVYSDRPQDVAADFAACGARHIHLVDLEGARDGGTPNLSVIETIAAKTALDIEVGGGIRSEETVKRYLGAGVGRTILGTAAAGDPDFLARMVACYGEAIAVSVDLRDGFVATHGWTQKSALDGETFVRQLSDMGVRTVIVTDISRDGAMRGTNLALYRALGAVSRSRLVASGGVSSLDDVRALREAGLYGAIIGKAYYTGAIDLRRALEVAV